MGRETREVETMPEVVKGIMAEGGKEGVLEGSGRQLVSTGPMLRLTVLYETTILSLQTATFRIQYLVVRALTTIQRTTATLGDGKYLASRLLTLVPSLLWFRTSLCGKVPTSCHGYRVGEAASPWLLSWPLLLLVLFSSVV